MKESSEPQEYGTLIFWDPVIQRALPDQSALQWICSARLAFGRIFDLCLMAKVGPGWYLSDRPQAPAVFAHPINIRFAIDPELTLDKDIEVLGPLQRQAAPEGSFASFRKKICFAQRMEIPRDKDRLDGHIIYDVFKNEVMQPTAKTHFSISLKE